MNRLTLKHLRYFLALTNHGQLTKAAEACAISQPAMSQQIKQFEDIIGQPILERTSRGLELTALGRSIESKALEIVQSVDELSNFVRANEGELYGELRLGVIPTVAPYLLPKLIQGFAQRLPRVELAVRETITPTLSSELENGTIDAAIVALPIAGSDFYETPLFSESFVLVQPEDARGKPLPDISELRQMRLLLLEEGHCFRDQTLELCDLGSRETQKIMSGSSLSTLVQMVAAGLGVTLIPEMSAEIEARTAPVVTSRLDTLDARRDIGLVWRRSNPLHQHFQQLVEIVRDVATDIYDQPRLLGCQS
ncbi:MAG: hydrogen peroxide-inducible genes activator [Pseudomonadota bacterium]